jgi:glc operon protein GlcG
LPPNARHCTACARGARSLDLAKKMAAGCMAKATQENWKMNIAIVNDGTNLVYFEHMDGAFVADISISQSKAITAAQSAPLRNRWRRSRSRHGSSRSWPFPGGLPIITGSEVQIGGIGVSGGNADQDEQCAKAGLDAAADDLK